MVTVLVQAGQTTDNFTFSEFAYMPAPLIDTPTLPEGGVVEFVHPLDGFETVERTAAVEAEDHVPYPRLFRARRRA